MDRALVAGVSDCLAGVVWAQLNPKTDAKLPASLLRCTKVSSQHSKIDCRNPASAAPWNPKPVDDVGSRPLLLPIPSLRVTPLACITSLRLFGAGFQPRREKPDPVLLLRLLACVGRFRRSATRLRDDTRVRARMLPNIHGCNSLKYRTEICCSDCTNQK